MFLPHPLKPSSSSSSSSSTQAHSTSTTLAATTLTTASRLAKETVRLSLGTGSTPQRTAARPGSYWPKNNATAHEKALALRVKFHVCFLWMTRCSRLANPDDMRCAVIHNHSVGRIGMNRGRHQHGSHEATPRPHCAYRHILRLRRNASWLLVV